MSGITAMMILDAMTFGHMRLDWEAEDEVRSMMKRPNPADDEDNPSRLRIAEVANIWSKRLSDAYIGFSCPTPSELSVLHKKITDIGVYLGCDSDIEALFRGVPADDINP